MAEPPPSFTDPSKDNANFTLEFNTNDQEFTDINIEFERVLTSLSNDDQMTKFRQEYEKMFRALVHSRDNTAKFLKQHALLESEFSSNIDSVHTTVQASAEDQETINGLRDTIKSIQKGLVDSAYKEESGKEQLRVLRGDISSLVTTVKQGVGLSSVQEHNLQELHTAKEQTSKELDLELDKIVDLRSKIQAVAEQVKQTDEQKRLIEFEIYEAKEKNSIKKGDIEGELRSKERLEKELRNLRVSVASKMQESRVKQETANKYAEDIQSIDYHIKTQYNVLERLQKDQENLAVRSVKLKESCSDQIQHSHQLADENKLLEKDIGRKNQGLAKLHTETKKIVKIREILAKKIRALEEKKHDIDNQRRQAKMANEGQVDEITRARRQVDIYKRTIDDFERERGLIDDEHAKTCANTQKNIQLMYPFKQTRDNLELEIARFKREIHDLKKILQQIELERDMYIKEAAVLQGEVVDSLGLIKKKEIQIYEYKKQMVQADTKLKHQQALYEAVQSDRNLHAKHLLENQSEIAEMKRKLKIMNYQINGYKEDINGKDEYLSKEKQENTRLLRDIKDINDETDNLKNQNDIAQAYIKTQLAEEMKLNQFVKEAELERNRQENAWQILISERDNLCNQLMKQDDELTKVYGKIKSNSTSLMTSEKAYYKRLSEISGRRMEIHELADEKRQLSDETSMLRDMKLKLCRMENDVVFEKTRVKALEQELENQINVHRWRKLEGSNPKAFQMIQLLQSLQRKLIQKSREEDSKMTLLSETEEMYLHCKTLLANQVGPEALEQVRDFEKMLKDKNGQLRHMETELNMYQAQSKEYKHAVGMLDGEIEGLKGKYMSEYAKAGGGLDRTLFPPIPMNVLPPLPIKDIHEKQAS